MYNVMIQSMDIHFSIIASLLQNTIHDIIKKIKIFSFIETKKITFFLVVSILK